MQLAGQNDNQNETDLPNLVFGAVNFDNFESKKNYIHYFPQNNFSDLLEKYLII